jgi:hypothetical protein
MREKLRLREIGKKYTVPCPKRLKDDAESTTIKINFTDGEYQYTPESSWFGDINFTSDELRAIADKLDELNND